MSTALSGTTVVVIGAVGYFIYDMEKKKKDS